MLSGELQLWHLPSILQGVLMSKRWTLMGDAVLLALAKADGCRSAPSHGATIGNEFRNLLHCLFASGTVEGFNVAAA